MNKEQITAALLGLFGLTGPVAQVLVNTFHVPDASVQSILTICSVLTPLIVGAAFAYMQRDSAKVAGVAHMSAPEQQAALNKIPDAAKIQVAEAVPDVATVVIKDGTDGAIATLVQSDAHPNIVSETQNEADAKKGTKSP